MLFASHGFAMFAGALVALASSGCTTTGSPDGIAPAQASSQGTFMASKTVLLPLKTDALRTLLSNANVNPVQPPGIITSHLPGEVFRADGLYVRIVGRTRVYGTFNIQEDSVCVQGDGFERQCRQFFVRGDGTYTLLDVAKGTTKLVNITPHR